MYFWYVSGLIAILLVKKILPYLTVKKREAEIFLKQLKPCEITEEIKEVRQQKHNEIPMSYKMSAAYGAGIVDGDGCVNTHGKSGSIIRVSRKWSSICDLFKLPYGGSVNCGIFNWRLSNVTNNSLLQDIKNCIRGKKRQIELLLHIETEEAPRLHDILSPLKWNNSLRAYEKRQERLKNEVETPKIEHWTDEMDSCG